MGLPLRDLPSISGVRVRTYLVDTYLLTTNVQSIDEGLQFSVNLTTTNVPNGTLVPYTITGVTSDDLYGAPLTGNFVVGSAETITFLTSQDFITEGPEYATISLDNGKSSTEILIKDTATEYDPYWETTGTSLLLTGEDFGSAAPDTITDTGGSNTVLTKQGFDTYVRPVDLYGNRASFAFNGSSHSVSFAANSVFNIGTQDASVELFVFFDAAPVEQTLCGQNSSSAATIKLWVLGGKFRCSVNQDSNYIAGPDAVARKWYHCLATYTASTQTVRFFIDGVLVGVMTNVASITARSEAYFIGSEPDGTARLAGRISNFRYCVGGIPTEYATSSVEVGQKLITVPTSKVPVTANTVLLTACAPYVRDESIYKHAFTANVYTSIFSPFPRPEKYQYGVQYFDGRTLVANDTSTALNFGTGAFTVETWVNLERLSTGSDSSYFNVLLMSLPVTGGFQLYKVNTNNNINYGATNIWGHTIIPAASVNAGRWYHIAIVRSSTATNGTRIYINGRLTSTLTDTQNYNVNGVAIGGLSSGLFLPGYLGPTRVVKGVAVYNSDFTPAPLTAVAGTSLLLNYQNVGITDKSTQTAPITRTWGAAPNSAVKKYGERSIFFSGAQRLDFNYNAAHHLTGDFTIEFWMNPSTTAAGAAFIVNMGGCTNISWYSYAIVRNGATIAFYSSFANTGNDVSFGMPNAVTVGTWTHIAVTRSGNTFRGYVNGIKIAETTAVGTPIDTTPRGLQIGAAAQNTWGSTPCQGYHGYIDDLRITKGVARYTSAVFAPPARLPTK